MNKKISTIVFSAVLLAFIAVGIVAAAQIDGCKIKNVSRIPTDIECKLTTQSTSTGSATYCMYNDGDCGMCCMLNGVYNITDWMFVILMAVSSLMIIWGAVLFTTSGGDPNKTGSARQLILFAAVGIAVALFARAIPPAVKMIIGA
jgi:hypothetical protein